MGDERTEITPRQIGVWLAAVSLMLLADPRPATFAAGCGLVSLAWVLRIWAFGHLEKNKTMVTTGPYAHTRNPAYLGSFLALAGVALAAGNGQTAQGIVVWSVSLGLALVFFAGYMPRKFRTEYPRLEKLFGEDLRRHAENVPDFWPRLTPWRSGDDRHFSFARVTANHEWPWGAVLALLLTAIWFADRWSPVYAFFHSP